MSLSDMHGPLSPYLNSFLAFMQTGPAIAVSVAVVVIFLIVLIIRDGPQWGDGR